MGERHTDKHILLPGVLPEAEWRQTGNDGELSGADSNGQNSNGQNAGHAVKFQKRFDALI
jgi:hypothetical protein